MSAQRVRIDRRPRCQYWIAAAAGPTKGSTAGGKQEISRMAATYVMPAPGVCTTPLKPGRRLRSTQFLHVQQSACGGRCLCCVDFPIHSPLRVCLASGLLERRRIERCRREVDNLQKPRRSRRNMPNRGPLVKFPLCVNAVDGCAVRALSGRCRAVFLGLYSLSTLKGGRSRPLF
jgi:hypothetical protein